MRLCSIIILSLFALYGVINISKQSGAKDSLKSNSIAYQKKIPQKNPPKLLICIGHFIDGIATALVDNVRNIIKSFIYPIESLIKIFEFCKKIFFKIIYFITHPQPDHVYADIVDKKLNKIIDFVSKMNMPERFKWFGYIVTDFSIGYYAPYGLGWKVVSLSRTTVMSVKSLKYFDLLNKISSIDFNILKIVSSKNTGSLLNIKYSIEYMDQFRQYVNDVVRYDGC